MVSLKTENGTTEVSLRADKNLTLQDEIVQTVVSVLLAFRDRVEKNGQSVQDADKDAEIILTKANNIYRNMKKSVGPPKENGEPVNVLRNDSMKNVLQQVDSMLENPKSKKPMTS